MTLVPPRLCPGDRVRFVSPASPPTRDHVEREIERLTGWGLRVEVGRHAFDQVGYLAGRDEERLADLNAAIRDPGVRAVFATRGGKGAYRISDGLDFAAARRDPKPLVGFSDITILHLAFWNRCALVGMHGHSGAEYMRQAIMAAEPLTVRRDPAEVTSAVRFDGRATGPLIGGNLGTICQAIGVDMPSLAGAILLIETNVGTGLGHVDRALTQLIKSGVLDGVKGVAVGQFTGFESVHGDDSLGGWTVVDVLNDRLAQLGVPVLGGLPIGHGARSVTVPLGTTATIDTTAGTLTVEAGVS